MQAGYGKIRRRKATRAAVLVVMLIAFASRVYAQTDEDTLTEVSVRGKQVRTGNIKISEFSPGQKIKTIDSVTLQQYRLQSMANLLAQQVPVFVKSYGFNGLATLNFRGSSAAQSVVLWNGVPIENAALGIADVSTLPVLIMSQVNVVYGGSSALWGSGNVGGALLLEQEAPVFDTAAGHLSFCGGFGSFSQGMGGLKGNLSRRRWYFSGNVFVQTALNNFTYTNLAGTQTKMLNDHLQSETAQLRAAYKISSQSVAGISAWYQQDYRQVPPALYEVSSDKMQADRSLRLLADWNRQTVNNSWYAKMAFTRDEVKYSDSAIAVQTDNTTFRYYQEAGWKKQFEQYGRLILFVPAQVAWMDQPVTHELKQQKKVAAAGAYDINAVDNRLDVTVNAREEMIDSQAVFSPGADASFAVTHWFVVRANAQRTYRAPSLNELYYFPGGNTSLLPEQGWSEDAGYTVKARKGNVAVYHDVSVFNRDIHNWVIWLGGAIWTPHNIAEVHSRGIETENNISWSVGHWKVHLGVNTSYVLATTVNSYLQNDGSKGKQIPYAPRYGGQANAGFTYRRISLNYNHTYTGYRFTTTDESEYLPPYQTGNLQLMYNTHVSRHSLQLTGQCNNIWNQQYQVVAFRPMPGINWLIGFQIDII